MTNENSKFYKLFISHFNEEDDEYKLFLSKLDASQDFKWKNYAIKDQTIREEIEEQIIPVDVVIILSGLYYRNRELIQSYIDLALRYQKPIVIIRPYGMENVPSNLEEIATTVVGWSAPCIIDSIREALGEEVL